MKRDDDYKEGFIYLMFNYCDTDYYPCCFTGKKDAEGFPLAFYFEGDLGKPVDPEFALTQGFTMTPDDFDELSKIVENSILGKSEAVTKDETVDTD